MNATYSTKKSELCSMRPHLLLNLFFRTAAKEGKVAISTSVHIRSDHFRNESLPWYSPLPLHTLIAGCRLLDQLIPPCFILLKWYDCKFWGLSPTPAWMHTLMCNFLFLPIYFMYFLTFAAFFVLTADVGYRCQKPRF